MTLGPCRSIGSGFEERFDSFVSTLDSDLNSKALKAFNNSNTDDFGNQLFNVKKDNTVYLNTLSDEQLGKLGVPETGDVMYFNGKVCFRYYVAELEDYFDVDSRHISIDLLN